MKWLVLAAVLLAALLIWSVASQQQGVSSAAQPDEPAEPPADTDADTPQGSMTMAGSNDGLQRLQEAWARMEGFLVQGSIPQRSNNPNDVKGNYGGTVAHTATGIAVFDTAADGAAAAQKYITDNVAAHPDWNFYQFFAKVLGNLDGSPVNNDQGDSNHLAESVAAIAGFDPTQTVASAIGYGA